MLDEDSGEWKLEVLGARPNRNEDHTLRNFKVSNEKIRIPLSILHFAQSYWGKQGPLALALILSVLSRNLLSPKSASSADMWGPCCGPEGSLGVWLESSAWCL